MAKFSVSYIYHIRDKYSGPLARIRKATDRFRKSIKKATAEVLKSRLGMGAMVVSVGLLARSIFTTALSFEKSMNRVSAVTLASAKDMERMTAMARKMGATTAFTASQSAEAMTFLAQAGLSVNDVIEALPGTLQLAAAGNLDLASAADIATNVLAQMGLGVSELTRVNDVLSKAQSITNTDVMQLAEAMRPVGATAKNLGFDIELLAASLGVMANAGEKGSIAGTLFRNMLTNVAGASKKQIKIYKSLGVNLSDFVDKTGRIKDFEGFVAQMEALAEAGKLSIPHLQDLFGERGFRSAQLLISAGADSLRHFNKELKNAAGTAKEMARRQMAGLVGVTKELSSAWGDFKIALLSGRAGDVLISLIKSMKRLVEFVKPTGNLSDAIGRLFDNIGMALGPLTSFVGIITGGKFGAVNLIIQALAASIDALNFVLFNLMSLVETFGVAFGGFLAGGFSGMGDAVKLYLKDVDKVNRATLRMKRVAEGQGFNISALKKQHAVETGQLRRSRLMQSAGVAAQGMAGRKGTDGTVTVRAEQGTQITNVTGHGIIPGNLGANIAGAM